MREALEAPRALGVDTRTSLERDVRPRGSREDSRSRKHSTPTLELPATQPETRSRTTSDSGGDDCAIGGCRLDGDGGRRAPWSGNPRRRRDGGASAPDAARLEESREMHGGVTFAGALVGTARAGTSDPLLLGSLRVRKFRDRRRVRRARARKRVFASGRRRSIAVLMDVTCDRRDRYEPGPRSASPPSSRDRSTTTRINNRFPLLCFPSRVSFLSRSQARS